MRIANILINIYYFSINLNTDKHKWYVVSWNIGLSQKKSLAKVICEMQNDVCKLKKNKVKVLYSRYATC